MTGSVSAEMQSDFIEEIILTQGMQVQLSKWKNKLESGHKRVGWKIGFNTKADQARMKIQQPIVGFLTSESVLESGSTFTGNSSSKLMVEAEVAILLGQDVEANVSEELAVKAIKGFAPAIELVDIAKTAHDMSAILEGNIFHEAVIFGELSTNITNFKAQDISASVFVNDQSIQTGDASRYPENICDIVLCVANTLAKQGERLRAGDWIICGSITLPTEVQSGDKVDVSLSPLGSLQVNILK